MGNILVYCKIVWYGLRSQFAYPINACFGLLNQFLYFFMEFLAMWALFAQFDEMCGWTLQEVFLTYGIINWAFAMAEVFMRGFESNMFSLVRNGEYDRYLLRPVNTIVQISAFSFQLARLGRAIQAFIVLIVGIVINRNLINSYEWLVLVYTIIAGCLLYFALYMFVGIIIFKITQNTEFMSVFIQGSVSTMQYPMIAFPRWLQKLFTYVLPATTVTYFPIATILDKPISISPTIGYLVPGICYLYFGLALVIFRLVEKSYISTGN